MTRRDRMTTAAAAALLLALVLGGCGGTEPASSSTPEDSASTQSSTEQEHEPGHESEQPESESESPAPDKEPATTVAVTVRGDAITPTAKAMTVAPGETVVLEIDSDRAGELHVHSTPEQEVGFDAGRSTVRITLEQPGSVDVEEHESGALLLRILVR